MHASSLITAILVQIMETSKAFIIMALLLQYATVTMALIPSESQDLAVATEEMQKANYFTFVMLLNMAPPDLFHGKNITFLMPSDRALSKANMSEMSVVDFLLHHSIPSPLSIDRLEHFPMGSLMPTSAPSFMLKIANNGKGSLLLNNVRITCPDICTKGTWVRCHGIDGVLRPALIPQLPTCPKNTTSSLTSQSPRSLSPQVSGIASPPSAVDVSPPRSYSPTIRIHGAGLVNSIMMMILSFVMLSLMNS